MSSWTSAELDELQDDSLVREALWRPKLIEKTYRNIFKCASKALPSVFGTSLEDTKYSLKLFLWAWNSIQARAFGRRLPWTAMVPFADCLNHQSVATKYSWDGSHFKLFPTGKNYYKKGCEVYNSYGRRSNRNLLLHYGFSMPENEWDTIQIYLRLDETDPLLKHKSILLRRNYFSSSQMFRLEYGQLSQKCLAFCRVLVANEAEVELMHRVGFKRKPIHCRNEVAALLAFRGFLQNYLESFPTSFDFNVSFINLFALLNS